MKLIPDRIDAIEDNYAAGDWHVKGINGRHFVVFEHTDDSESFVHVDGDLQWPEVSVESAGEIILSFEVSPDNGLTRALDYASMLMAAHQAGYTACIRDCPAERRQD